MVNAKRSESPVRTHADIPGNAAARKYRGRGENRCASHASAESAEIPKDEGDATVPTSSGKLKARRASDDHTHESWVAEITYELCMHEIPSVLALRKMAN